MVKNLARCSVVGSVGSGCSPEPFYPSLPPSLSLFQARIAYPIPWTRYFLPTLSSLPLPSAPYFPIPLHSTPSPSTTQPWPFPKPTWLFRYCASITSYHILSDYTHSLCSTNMIIIEFSAVSCIVGHNAHGRKGYASLVGMMAQIGRQ